MIKRDSKNLLGRIWWELDKSILLCILLVMFFGVILIFSASPFVADRIGVPSTYFIYNHFLYLAVSFVVMFSISLMNREKIVLFAISGFALFYVLLIVVALIGQEVNGAKRWLFFLGFSIQPSEFIKVFFIVFTSYLWHKLVLLNKDKLFIYTTVSIVYVMVVFLVLMQPDLGMTLLITSAFSSLIVTFGISLFWIIVILIFVSGLLVSSYFILPHVSYRINTFLFEETSYQTTRALDAVKSGKLFGKGVGNGTVKRYIPDAHTDFIFSVSLEEFGLILNILLLCLYLFIFYRSIRIVMKDIDLFKIFSVVGCNIILLTQCAIHVGSNINLIPTKGMTLPFISSGGSSTLATAVLMGFILYFTKKDIKNVVSNIIIKER